MYWFRCGAVLFVTIFIALLLSPTAQAADFPHFEAETLTGKKLTLPRSFGGHCALLIIGFSQASRGQTMEWAKKTRSTPDPFACTVWSVAVLEEAPRLLRGLITRGIRSGIPKDQQENFLIVNQGETELKTAAGYQQPDDAYLILLDGNGALRYRSHGPFSDAALIELRKQIR